MTRPKYCPTPRKKRFTKRQAQLALVALTIRYNGGRRPTVERRAYKCPSGRHWHLTSKPTDPRASLDSTPDQPA